MLAVSHVVSAVVALLVIAIGVWLRKALARGSSRSTHSRLHALRRRAERPITLLQRLTVAVFWIAMTALGWLVANKRYGLVAPVVQPFVQELATHGHRIDHALCLPVPPRPYWIVRCRGCGAWILLREVPSLDLSGVDLQIVRGRLHDGEHCTARYLTAERLAQDAHRVLPVDGRQAPRRSR